MPRGKMLEKTWFNRLVKAPVILIFWIIFYPFYALGMLISGFCILFWQEVIKEVFFGIIDTWQEYIHTIKSGIKFIKGI